MTNPENPKGLKVVFAPGCFDQFEGTQEELDEMIAQITAMAESGELLEQSTVVNLDDLSDEELAAIGLEAFEFSDEEAFGVDDNDDDEGDVITSGSRRVLH